MCAVPSSSSTIYDDNSILFDTDGLLTDISIQKLRKSIECTVDVFGRIARVGIFKVFGKLFAQYKSDAEKLVVELKSCESMTNPDLKSKYVKWRSKSYFINCHEIFYMQTFFSRCIKTIYIGYIYTVVRLDYKLDQVSLSAPHFHQILYQNS